MRHERFGELEWVEDGWWTGRWQSLEILIGGWEDGPNAEEAAEMAKVLDRWERVLAEARAFVTTQKVEQPKGGADALTPTSIACVNGAGFFCIDFAAPGDKSLWRVEFEGGAPAVLQHDE